MLRFAGSRPLTSASSARVLSAQTLPCENASRTRTQTCARLPQRRSRRSRESSITARKKKDCHKELDRKEKEKGSGVFPLTLPRRPAIKQRARAAPPRKASRQESEVRKQGSGVRNQGSGVGRPLVD